MRNVMPQDKLADYNPAEARGIAIYINQTETLDQCAQTVLKYRVLDEEGFYALSHDQDLPALKKSLIVYMEENTREGLGVLSIIEPQGK